MASSVLNLESTAEPLYIDSESLDPDPDPVAPSPPLSAQPATMDNAYALPIDAVLANFSVKEQTGLTDSQVSELRNKHGRNGAHPQILQSFEFLSSLRPLARPAVSDTALT